MGFGAHLHLDSTQATGSRNRAQDAQAQRDRSLDNDAENRLGALPATGALKAASSPARNAGGHGDFRLI